MKEKIKDTKEKIKTIAKYTTNFIGMIMFIITGLNAIDGINIPIQVYEVLGVIQGCIGVYLVKGKLWATPTEYEDAGDLDE